MTAPASAAPALTETAFRDRLVALGLTLDEPALAAAWLGAQHLRAQVAQLDAWLAQTE